MASPKLIKTGLPTVAPPARILPDHEGKIAQTDIEAMNLFFRNIAQTLNGELSLGGGVNHQRSGNLDGQWLLFTSAAVNGEFTVYHSLGRVPIGWFVVRQDKPGSLYADRFTEWTAEKVFFKVGTSSGVSMAIILF